jgi:hypothetical protein
MVTALFFYVVALMLIFSAVIAYNNYKVRKKEMTPVRVAAHEALQHAFER